MEQIFKFSQAEVNGIEGIKQLVDDEFMKLIMNRFNEMYLSFKSTKERNS